MSQSAETAAGDGHPVTVVTQTRAKDDKAAAFSAWQKNISEVVSRRPGFIKQTVIPPSPPVQLDWVILQRFTDRDSALAWLNSADRKRLVAEAGDMLVGQDDVHLLRDDTEAVAAPVSAVISTRIKAGQEDAYRRWEQKIAAVQAQAPGFQGYRFRGAGARGPGRLAGDSPVRLRGASPGVVRFARTEKARRRVGRISPTSTTPGSSGRVSTSGSRWAAPRAMRRRPGSRTCWS